LTAFGAAAIREAPPEPWSEDLASVRTVAALSDLWLGIEDHGPAVRLSLTSWRRLPNGLLCQDPRTGAERRLAADSELSVRLGSGIDLQALVFARTERIPRARLASVLARWTVSLATAASARSASAPTAALLVLTGTERGRARILTAAQGVTGPHNRLAVGAVERGALVTDPLWRTAADELDRRLVDVLASMAEDGK
ncbi:MAG: hypothetical protein ACRD6W_00235, partial [Nitrososphaerales archaeon]